MPCGCTRIARSASGNFWILLCIFSAISFATTIPFVIMGAWPVAGFMGVDVAIFYFAFRANFRAARLMRMSM